MSALVLGLGKQPNKCLSSGRNTLPPIEHESRIDPLNVDICNLAKRKLAPLETTFRNTKGSIVHKAFNEEVVRAYLENQAGLDTELAHSLYAIFDQLFSDAITCEPAIDRITFELTTVDDNIWGRLYAKMTKAAIQKLFSQFRVDVHRRGSCTAFSFLLNNRLNRVSKLRELVLKERSTHTPSAPKGRALKKDPKAKVNDSRRRRRYSITEGMQAHRREDASIRFDRESFGLGVSGQEGQSASAVRPQSACLEEMFKSFTFES